MSSRVFCSYCATHVTAERIFDCQLCCTICGKVLEDQYFSSEPTFVKNSSGQSSLSGNYVRTVQSDYSASRQRTLDKAYDDMKYLKDSLQIDESDQVVEVAFRFYTVAFERNFTRGRRVDQVQAACLYLACRETEKPFLLIDFSNYLAVNVYELGDVYLQLCEVLYIANEKDSYKLVDPSIFLHRFMNSLLPGDKNADVLDSARNIILSMKRDWMQTGRKPSGLCGAALYIAALSHGIKCSKSDIVKVVHICEATLTERLIEFENTDSGCLSVEELKEKTEGCVNFSSTKQPNEVLSSTNELLCKHKDVEPFAYRLCEECYKDFIKISGGTAGGSDPPAFQAAERQRIAKESALKNVDENDDLTTSQKLNELMKNPSINSESMGINDDVFDKVPVVDDGAEALDESDNLSDINDPEIDAIILDEEEQRLKKIVWETMNAEYLEEQAAKAAAKKASEAKDDHDCPEELRAAHELAAATEAAVAKSRKEKQQKRAADARNATPAQTAAEAVHQMLSTKKLSSKINYSVLDKLFDDLEAPEITKKQRRESSPENEEYLQEAYV